MHILFHNGVPRGLAQLLAGHTVEEARGRGWETLVNGELIQAAERAGFDLMITTDKNIRYQQNLSGRALALIVLERSQWPLVQLASEHIAKVIATVVPGSYQEVEIPAIGD